MKEKIKDYLYKDGKLIHQRLQERIFNKEFPTYKKSHDELSLNNDLWLFVNDLSHTDFKCKSCSSQTAFKSFNLGYREFCSNTCVNKHNAENKEFSKKISETRTKKYSTEYYLDKYGYPRVGDKFLYYNKLIDRNKLIRILDSGYVDTKEYFISHWEDFKHKVSEEWVSLYFPLVYKEIITNYQNLDCTFQQKKYMYINDLANVPKCPSCNINNTDFNYSSFSFNYTCKSVNCRKSSSSQEREIYEYVINLVKELELEVINNFRIDNNEIDIYIPKLKLGIEFNGLYWHSEKYKEKDYHLKKKEFFKDRDIDIFFIWEDDWHAKKDLIKSMIKNKLGLSSKIFARKCEVKPIRYDQASKFHKNNHLRGSCIGKNHIGLFYDNDLVSCCTFGKSRFKESGNIELIRFSSRQGTSVIGGFSKILSFYIKSNKFDAGTKIISYADYDISNGNVYEKTGFNSHGHTGVGFYWIKGKERYSRQSLWKLSKGKQDSDNYLRNLGYTKIWNAGNLKYVLELK